MMRGVIVLQHISEQCLQRVLLCTGARLAHTMQSVQLLHLSQKLVVSDPYLIQPAAGDKFSYCDVPES
jgi:hypothetical protein